MYSYACLVTMMQNCVCVGMLRWRKLCLSNYADVQSCLSSYNDAQLCLSTHISLTYFCANRVIQYGSCPYRVTSEKTKTASAA